jgi:opacity protein-like surface antigen
MDGTYTARIPFTGATPPAVPVHFLPDPVKLPDTFVPQPGQLGPGNVVLPNAGGGGGSSRYSLWLAVGSTFPQGSFGNGYDSDFSGALGFEYAFTPAYSVEAVLGGLRFKGKGGTPKLDATQFGVNAKWYLMPADLRPFATLGIGAYAFDPGSTRFGANAGLGLQFDVSPQLALEGRYAFHAVSSNAPNSRFSTLLVGVRFSF